MHGWRAGEIVSRRETPSQCGRVGNTDVLLNPHSLLVQYQGPHGVPLIKGGYDARYIK